MIGKQQRVWWGSRAGAGGGMWAEYVSMQNSTSGLHEQDDSCLHACDQAGARYQA